MVDRPIRPLWPKGFRNEVQIIGTVLSIDGEHSHDTLAINGASAALTISPLPFFGPVGAVRIGRIDGQIVVNPLMTQMEDSDLDLIVCGTLDAITMVEAGAKEISEDAMLQAFEAAHAAIKTLCQAQLDLRAKVGQPKWQDAGVQSEIESRYAQRFDALLAEHGLAGIALAEAEASAAELAGVTGNATEADMVRRVQVRAAISAIGEARRSAAVKSAVEAQFRDALRELSDAEQDSKELKSAKRSALYARIEDELQLPFPSRVDGKLDSLARSYARSAADSVYKQIVREKIAIEKRRPDGRAADEIRPIATEVGVTPRTHGSGLFTRGQTQALTLVTLGTAKEEQRIDDLSLDSKKRYIHHYNFPPFSVGETGFMRGPKRRDIGHGALAERALVPVIPDAETFPYTMRVVSEILESNGSSSMASVCGSTMALMDAGVPITSPVAGIAMGLIKEGDDYTVLTDIAGVEDHLGDMDFKVAGTGDGITALQMDIKITGVTQETMRSALAQARDARLRILEYLPGLLV
jgi:polyribonucleotide nucleotidyltransferase